MHAERHVWVEGDLALMLSGFATGLLSGGFGVGDGFLIVPTLRATTELNMHRQLQHRLLIGQQIYGEADGH